MNKTLLNPSLSTTYLPNYTKKKIFLTYKRKKRESSIKQEPSFEAKMKIVIEGQSGASTINEICEREDISNLTFQKWTEEMLDTRKVQFKKSKEQVADNESLSHKFEIALEGVSGKTGVHEICRREGISHETFLNWSSEFLQFKKENSKERNFRDNSTLYNNSCLINERASIEVFNYLENYIDFSSTNSKVFLKANNSRFESVTNLDSLVNLQKINDIRFINKYFEKVNSKLEKGGLFAGCLETFQARRQRKKINKIPIINNFFFTFEFFFKRILPKVSFTKKHYFDITKGNDRLLSKAEGLGRLVSCGFKLIDFHSIDGLLYFVVKKESEPTFDMSPSYGPLYKMPRLGKKGKMIGVYKFRTMHPYSEYLQDFIVRANGYAETGKPADDFRIPKWGKIMRKFWLDEIPQLLNVLKGEMKLVGVRPVSVRYFEDIPKEMQKLRLTQKPGCIPPYVALNRSGNVMSVLQAEKDYLEDKIRNPFYTDMKYFVNAIFNIVFKHKRSA